MSQEPEVGVKRDILKHKLGQLRAQGYEFAVNAELARVIGDAQEEKRNSALSGQSYMAAARAQEMLDALGPDTAEA